MEEEMVYVFHYSIEITIRLLTHPPEHVVNCLLETLKLRSERRGQRIDSSLFVCEFDLSVTPQ
jgi:hypothetical protein